MFIRKDTDEEFQFRIRNLSYPSEVYIVEIDAENQVILVKTTNKKYYKKIDVPDLTREGIKLEKNSLTWVYKNNTLIISYKKPP